MCFATRSFGLAKACGNVELACVRCAGCIPGRKMWCQRAEPGSWQKSSAVPLGGEAAVVAWSPLVSGNDATGDVAGDAAWGAGGEAFHRSRFCAVSPPPTIFPGLLISFITSPFPHPVPFPLFIRGGKDGQNDGQQADRNGQEQFTR